MPYHPNFIVIFAVQCAISSSQSRKILSLKVTFIMANLMALDNLTYFRIMHKLSQWLKMLKDWKYSTCDQNTNWKGCICQIVRRGNFPLVCIEGLILIQTKVSWHVAVSFDLLDLLNSCNYTSIQLLDRQRNVVFKAFKILDIFWWNVFSFASF